MSLTAGIVLLPFINLQGQAKSLLQSGGSYLVVDTAALQRECKHDEGFSLTKVEPDLHGYACNCRCGFSLSFNPADFTASVAYVRHEPSPEDKVLPPIDWKAGEH